MPPDVARRWGWWLWTAAFLVLIALTVAVTLLQGWLQIPNQRLRAGGALRPAGARLCLLIVSKQVQLHRLQSMVNREEQDLTDMRTRLSEITELFRLDHAESPSAARRGARRSSCAASSRFDGAARFGDGLRTPTPECWRRALPRLRVRVHPARQAQLGEGIAGWVAQAQGSTAARSR
jgi:hypothetical protein